MGKALPGKILIRLIFILILVLLSSNIFLSADNARSAGVCEAPGWCSLPWGGIITSGQSVEAYLDNIVPCGSSCDDIKKTRTCTNHVLLGDSDYDNETCIVDCRSCGLPWGGAIPTGGQVTAYQNSSVPCNSTCSPGQTRTCTDGTLGGDSSYQYELCTVEACVDTTRPEVTAFTAIASGGLVAMSYSVKDEGGSHLKRIEFWRAPDNAGTAGSWSEVTGLRQTIDSQNIDTHDSDLTDNPGAGTWWYGLHVYDKAMPENMGTETTSGLSPIKVTIASACADADGDSYDNCSPGQAGGDDKQMDCDDTKNYVYPTASETCDILDNNCNGQTDEGCDNDDDGFCDKTMQIYNDTSMCSLTIFINNGMYGDDCDDEDDSKYPGGASCGLTYCGDNIIQISPPNDDGVTEECDDGNTAGGDGCDENCQNEP